jgi:hypothetical protein
MKSLIWIACLAFSLPVVAGPYSQGLGDAGNLFDAPVPGFTGPHGVGKARLDDGLGGVSNPDNYVNPLFFAWADGYQDYERSDSDTGFNDPTWALGPVTGDNFDVVSLGDMTSAQITNGDPPGRITLSFSQPIRDLSGADFVIFENGFVSQHNTGGTGIGGVFAELAHVEVSADGVTFHRFPSTSLTAVPVGGYGSINPTDVHNLAGKHVNAYGDSWGTPFDIGQLGLGEISHIRLIDVPGDGSFPDSSGQPIFDSWRTFGSGGFDLEAVGAVSIDMTYEEWPSLEGLADGERGENDDPDHDGIPNLLEYAFGLVPWEADPPSSGWSFSLVEDGGSMFCEVTTLRDERLLDLTREIQVSTDMAEWKTIAVSTAGAPFQSANGHVVSSTHENAGTIASVGVIRRDRVRDSHPVGHAEKRFYRLMVGRSAP